MSKKSVAASSQEIQKGVVGKGLEESGLLMIKTRQTQGQSAIRNIKIPNILALTLVASIALLVIVGSVNPALANSAIFVVPNCFVIAGLFAAVAYHKDSSNYRESKASARDLDLVRNFLLGKQLTLEKGVANLLSKFKKETLTTNHLLDVVDYIVGGSQNSLANKTTFVQDKEGFEAECESIYKFLNSKEYSYQNDNFESSTGKMVQKFILMNTLLTEFLEQKQDFKKITSDDLIAKYKECESALLKAIEMQYPEDGNKSKIEQIKEFMQDKSFLLDQKVAGSGIVLKESLRLQAEGLRAINSGRK